MRRNTGLVGIGLALGMAAMGCSNAHEADHDSGLQGGDGAPVADAAMGEPCGSITCPVGRVCCNASCGICTLPTEGCVALDCSDAGPIARNCGGFLGEVCAASEYCDYPDSSYCGGDDSTGICRPRPRDCPDPGGNLVCGCDGHPYIGDCSAYLAGTDIAHQGSCESPPPPSNGITATPTCGPADGAAWNFFVSPSATCTATPGASGVELYVWEYLEGAAPGTYTIGGDFGTSSGSASYCPGGFGPPCETLTGTFTVHSFVAGSTAEVSYELNGAATGTRYAASHMIIGTWCPSERFCG